MKKGEATRRNIIRKSAVIFNQKGYMTTTMNDIIHATNIQKGGIYRHFQDKEQLMHEAFRFSIETMHNHLRDKVSNHSTVPEKLNAFVEAFLQLADGEPMIGGCPIVNAAIEMDDLEGNTLLPTIREAMEMLLYWLTKIIEDGIEQKQLQSSLQPFETAVYLLSTLEGGLILEKLKKDSQSINIIRNQLTHFISCISVNQQ